MNKRRNRGAIFFLVLVLVGIGSVFGFNRLYAGRVALYQPQIAAGIESYNRFLKEPEAKRTPEALKEAMKEWGTGYNPDSDTGKTYMAQFLADCNAQGDKLAKTYEIKQIHYLFRKQAVDFLEVEFIVTGNSKGGSYMTARYMGTIRDGKPVLIQSPLLSLDDMTPPAERG